MATAKRGRPTNALKDTMLRVRVDSDTLEKLDFIVQDEDSNRSEVIRKAIDCEYVRKSKK